MTAIAGYWSLDGRPDAASRCSRMLEAQRIYGPGPPAVAGQGPLAIGQRLFSRSVKQSAKTIGVARSGDEALLVADVRLDNRQELAAALRVAEGEAKRLSEPELLLRALQCWGEDALERVEGDFAFAFWDAPRQRLMLARDFLGQQPLHYSHGRGFFAFASMAKGLHALPEVLRSPNLDALAGLVALLPESGTETFFESVEKVQPGHLVTVTKDGIRSQRWWRPSLDPLQLPRPEEYAEALRERCDNAVQARLRGSGPVVAAHLSGGLDSSVVAATAARLLSPSGGRVTAFTAVPRPGYQGAPMREGIQDEGPLAASVAAMHANMDHVLVPNGGSPFAALDRYFLLYERPVLNLCNSVWSHHILDRAREGGLRVLLTGAFGTMSLSHDGMPLLSRLLRQGRLLRLAHESIDLVREGARFGTVAAQAVGPYLPARLWRAIGRLRGASRSLTDYTAIAPEAIRAYRIGERAAERGLDLSYRPPRNAVEARLWVLRRVDMGNYNKGTLGGWGIDTRDPTADRRLVEFCLRVPEEQYLRRGIRRALVRDAFADRIPAQVRQERRKGYQAPDWHVDLRAARDEAGEEIGRIGNCGQARAILDCERMKRLVRDWPDTGWEEPATVQKYRLALLRGVSIGHFTRCAAGSNH